MARISSGERRLMLGRATQSSVESSFGKNLIRLKRQVHGTKHNCVAPKCSRSQIDGAQQGGADACSNRVDKCRPLPVAWPAEHDDLRIENNREVANHYAEKIDRFAKHDLSGRVTLQRERKHVLCTKVSLDLADQIGQAGGGIALGEEMGETDDAFATHSHLQGPDLTGVVKQRVDVADEVGHFTRSMARAVIQLALNDDPGPDPGTNTHENHIARTPCNPLPELSQGCQVDIILNPNPHAKLITHHLP